MTDQIKRELRSRTGDATNVALPAAGYNFRLLIAWLAAFLCLVLASRTLDAGKNTVPNTHERISSRTTVPPEPDKSVHPRLAGSTMICRFPRSSELKRSRAELSGILFELGPGLRSELLLPVGVEAGLFQGLPELGFLRVIEHEPFLRKRRFEFLVQPLHILSLLDRGRVEMLGDELL